MGEEGVGWTKMAMVRATEIAKATVGATAFVTACNTASHAILNVGTWVKGNLIFGGVGVSYSCVYESTVNFC